MTIQVKHTTSVQGVDCADKSVNASDWNADHFISGAVSVGGLNALSAAVSTVASNLSALSVQHSSLSADHSALSALHSTLSATVSTNAVQVSALSVAVSVVQANVSTLSVQVSVLSAALSNEISARALSVNNLSAVVSTNLAQVSSLSALHSTLSAVVSTNAVQVSALSVAVSIVQVNVSTLSVQLSVLSAQVSTESVLRSVLSAQVSVLSAQVSTESVLRSVVSAQLSTLSALHSTLSVQVSAISVAASLRIGREAVAIVGNQQFFSISTPTNVSGMGLSVGLGNTYAFKYYVIYQASSTGSGLGLTVTFPGMKNFAATAMIDSGVVGTAAHFGGAITASGTRIQAISCQTALTKFYATVEGIAVVSATGTLQLQAFPEVSGSAVGIFIDSGTTGHIWRLT